MTTDTGARVVLALDTSTDMLCCSVATWVPQGGPLDVRILAGGDHPCRRRTNVELTSTALDCLARAGLTMTDVDEILVGRGPGSFTGVRIGIATAKGLSCGLGAPLHGASTLDAMAWNAWATGVRGTLGVVGEAMRGEVYPGIYQLGEAGPVRTFATEMVCGAQACVDAWAARGDRAAITLTGDGLKRYRTRFEEAGFARFVPERWLHPSSEGLLCAAAATPRDDVRDSGDPALVLPIYTRLSDAEEAERRRLGLGESASWRARALPRSWLARTRSCADVGERHRAGRGLEAHAYTGGVHEPWAAPMFEEEIVRPGRTWWVAHDRGSVVGFAGGLLAGIAEVLDVAVSSDRRYEGSRAGCWRALPMMVRRWVRPRCPLRSTSATMPLGACTRRSASSGLAGVATTMGPVTTP